MNRVSVDTSTPSPYIEKNNAIYRFKRRLTYGFAFRLIKKYATRLDNISLLEIGTGSGYFLSFCQDFFRNPNLWGLEYDERLLKVTRTRTMAFCQQGNAENFDLGEQRFDIIVSFQVIEHLYAPEEMLTRVHKHLKPNGIFLVTSPNLDGFGAKWMGKKWSGYRDDHVSLKGVKDWSNMIVSTGFEKIYEGSTFFSGIPFLNRFPFGILNWILLGIFGSLKWTKGESFVGLYRRNLA